jgi:hypothetical protein
MTTKTALCETFKGARGTGKLTDHINLLRMLGNNMIL